MHALIAFLIILAVLLIPVSLVMLPIWMVRKRKRQEAAGLIPRTPRIITTASFREATVTQALLGVITLIFIGEMCYGTSVSGKPTIASLVAFGGVSKMLIVKTGEWYRLFTAPFLHGGMEHLLGNAVALFFAGVVLEKLVGHAWFLAIFMMGGLAGSLTSAEINPENLVSVGASGAIMALFAATFVISFHLSGDATVDAQGIAHRSPRGYIQYMSLRVLIPSLLPFLNSHNQDSLHIDFADHAGGAVCGAAIGLLLLGLWPKEDMFPKLRAEAGIVATLAVLASLFGFAMVVKSSGKYMNLMQDAAFLIPSAQLTKDNETNHSDWLVRQYPRDSRAHLFYAIHLLKSNQVAAAETEARAAVENADRTPELYKRSYVIGTHAVLATVLYLQGRQQEALKEAAQACEAPESDRPPMQIYSLLRKERLCRQ